MLKNKSCDTVFEKGNPFALLVGMKIHAATVESSMELPQKIKTELPYDPAILHLGIYLKKLETLIQKNTCTSMFAAVLFTVADLWKQPRCPLLDKQAAPRLVEDGSL